MIVKRIAKSSWSFIGAEFEYEVYRRERDGSVFKITGENHSSLCVPVGEGFGLLFRNSFRLG